MLLILLIFKTNGIRSKNNLVESCSHALSLSYYRYGSKLVIDRDMSSGDMLTVSFNNL